MELKSAESREGRAGIPREFSRPASSSSTERSSIQLHCPVLVSERARPQCKALACLWRGSAAHQPEVSAEVLPRGFSRQGSSTVAASLSIEASGWVAVRARAATGRGKSLRSTLTPNQPIERTLSRYALQRRSSPC